MALSGYKIYPRLTPLLLAAACSSLPPSAQNFDNFSDYAESVFRHQNLLTSRIMMMGGMEDDALSNAEHAMNDACHLLNEYAERESNGEVLGIFFKRQVQTSIENCDHQVQLLEALLPDLETPLTPKRQPIDY